MALDKKFFQKKLSIKSIKKVGNSYEVDGIEFATRELAAQYCEIHKGEPEADYDFVNHVPSWVGEKIDYIYNSEAANLPFKILVEKYAQENSLNISMVAEELGVSRQALFNWTSGEKMPDSKSIEKICNVFKLEEEEVNRALLVNFINSNKKMMLILKEAMESNLKNLNKTKTSKLG
jgi:DNA-binding XRE family transcriptional regulator